MKTIKTLLLATVLLPLTAMAQDKKKTIEVPDWMANLTERIQFNGYAQAGYTWRNQDGKNTNTLDVKRTLLWAKARITDRWSFLFMHDFSSVVQEFYTDYRVSNDKALSVRFGQFKIDVYSQGVTYLSGCGSDPLYGVQYGRDLGLMLYGNLFQNHLYYEMAVMQGQGINIKDKNNQKDVILRLDYRPVDNFRIVTSGQLGTGHAVAESKYNPTIAKDEDYKRNLLLLLLYLGEVLGGKDGDVKSIGAYVTGCVPVCDALDVVGSVDYFNYNTDAKMKQTNVTLGLQHWFYRLCRVQLQYTLSCPDHMAVADNPDNKTYGTLQAQVQVGF